MKKTLLLLLLGLLAHTAGAQSILVVGDSISAAYNIPVESGWVNLFRQKLADEKPGEHQVINASISGDTTSGGLARLPKLLDSFDPDIVVLELGGNDGLRGLSLSSMRQNLQRMIELSKSEGAQVLLVGVQLPRSYGSIFNQKFLEVYKTLAAQNDVPLAVLGFDLLNKPEFIQDDGLHPTEEAQPIILEYIWPYFQDHL